MLMREFISGILSGILAGIGGTVYLSCENKYCGAVFFSTALIFICMRNYSLYTGKVGFILDKFSTNKILDLFYCLLGNIVGAFVTGEIIKYCFSNLCDVAFVNCSNKMMQSPLQTFLRAVFCGILIYLSVVVYKESKSKIGILLGIPVFVLSGYEHCIANIFYFTVSQIIFSKFIVYFLITCLGNTCGSILFAYFDNYLKGNNIKNYEKIS